MKLTLTVYDDLNDAENEEKEDIECIDNEDDNYISLQE